MNNEIISYLEMCTRERMQLQKGMNFRPNSGWSIILMSVQANAPYRDRIEDDGFTLIYEGHDAPRTRRDVDPKRIDQPEVTPSGGLTENGRFHQAAQSYRSGQSEPRKVRVYEKIKPSIWSYNGLFHLVDSWRERDEYRTVFKFRLVAVPEETTEPQELVPVERQRIIPAQVKLEVWKRDGGKCVECGATDELHFDHIIPFSRGGTSLKADNIQLLCARHNLQKSDKIE